MKRKYTSREIINELIKYELKWEYEEFIEYYDGKADFIKKQTNIINNYPLHTYEYVADKFKEIINYYDLKDDKTIKQLHETTDLLIKIGYYLRVNGVRVI